MNVFRLLGDLSHLFALLYLLWKIWHTKSCAGISGKTQILYLIVFLTRYIDLFYLFISVYNSVLKVVFILGTALTVYLVYVRFPKTYDSKSDSFRIAFVLIPSALLALAINHDFTVTEVMWTFSIYLESIAILPQLFMISITGEAETITCHYLFALGSYRALYILNWIYRYNVEGYYDLIAIFAGIVQTLLYGEFFYLYFTKVVRGKKFETPEASATREKEALDRLHHEVCTEFFYDEQPLIEKDDQMLENSLSSIEQPPAYEIVVNDGEKKIENI